MCASITAKRVALDCLSQTLTGTGTRKNFLGLFLSIPPKIHCPSITLPTLYFLLPNFPSSISTITPSPPNFSELFFRAQSKVISLKNDNQSTMVFDDRFSSF
uniref:Uncharacterized protein n=1 Tax=Cacopsylla melanoneura TaxID=428564 RepID=A0A8D8TK76_9HEMI